MPHLPQSRLHPQARVARVAARSSAAPFCTLITLGATALAIGLGLGAAQRAHAAWEPSKPVEFVVPAGTGGGADQMARFIQGVVAKHNLMKQPMVVLNKSGGAGAEGFLDVKNDKATPTRSSSRCPTCSPPRWPPPCLSTGAT